MCGLPHYESGGFDAAVELWTQGVLQRVRGKACILSDVCTAVRGSERHAKESAASNFLPSERGSSERAAPAVDGWGEARVGGGRKEKERSCRNAKRCGEWKIDYQRVPKKIGAVGGENGFGEAANAEEEVNGVFLFVYLKGGGVGFLWECVRFDIVVLDVWFFVVSRRSWSWCVC